MLVSYRDRFNNLLRRTYFAPLSRYPDILRSDSTQYRVQQVDDWANLAFRMLSDENAWWAIADFNQVIDPFEELPPGQHVVVPSFEAYHLDVLDFEFAFTAEVNPEEEIR